MESSGAVAAKFCLKIRRRDVSSNSLTLPNALYSKYCNRLVGHVELNLRNGYVLPLRLDYNTGVLNGFLVFFMELELKGGEFMLFEYFGRYNFNVYLLGTNGTEIDYPHTVHYMQRRLPRAVNVGCGGWRFVKLQTEFDNNLDEITPTPAFLERCAVLLPDRITYIISNGKKFHGSYCHNAERFTGLRSLCDIVGVEDLSAFHMMLYEYHWQSVIKISVFDKYLNEIVFSGTPLSKDANSHCPSIGSYFAITISPKHMNEDCYTVDIPNEFSDLVNMWDKCQTISVYSEYRHWKLQTQKRDDYHCRTIEDGWQAFRDGMKVDEGDLCIFECPMDSFDQFSVRVMKHPDIDF